MSLTLRAGRADRAVACNHGWMECGASQYRHQPPSCPIHCNSCHQQPILQNTEHWATREAKQEKFSLK